MKVAARPPLESAPSSPVSSWGPASSSVALSSPASSWEPASSSVAPSSPVSSWEPGFFFGGAFFAGLFLGAGFFFGGAFFAGLFLGAGFFLPADFALAVSFAFTLTALLDGLRRAAFVPDPLDFGLIYQRYGGLGRLQWGDIIGKDPGPR